uniref:Uncharacterized protein n=1 Tax=Oreochromis niloticus TaxID=8128 RepID=A0A669C8X5_ORENI
MRKRDIATALLTMTQSGRSISFRRWQALVVTELAPAHHSIENSQRSLTTYRFTVMFRLRRSLSNTKTTFSKLFRWICRKLSCFFFLYIYYDT